MHPENDVKQTPGGRRGTSCDLIISLRLLQNIWDILPIKLIHFVRPRIVEILAPAIPTYRNVVSSDAEI